MFTKCSNMCDIWRSSSALPLLSVKTNANENTALIRIFGTSKICYWMIFTFFQFAKYFEIPNKVSPIPTVAPIIKLDVKRKYQVDTYYIDELEDMVCVWCSLVKYFPMIFDGNGAFKFSFRSMKRISTSHRYMIKYISLLWSSSYISNHWIEEKVGQLEFRMMISILHRNQLCWCSCREFSK